MSNHQIGTQVTLVRHHHNLQRWGINQSFFGKQGEIVGIYPGYLYETGGEAVYRVRFLDVSWGGEYVDWWVVESMLDPPPDRTPFEASLISYLQRELNA